MNKAIIRATVRIMILATTCMMMPCWAYGDNDEGPKVRKKTYVFHIPDTIKGLSDCQCAFYPFTGTKLYNCKGGEMFAANGDIVEVKFNPSVYNYGLIYNKKGVNKAVVSCLIDESQNPKTLDNKKLGEPLAMEYLPNARSLLLAVPGYVKVLDAIKLQPTDTIATEMSPDKLVMSNNLNYLALVEGSHVKVLNYETKRPRFDRKIDGNVAAVGFNDDCSQFAILTDDGSLQIYNTRNFTIIDTIDDFDGGIDFGYNSDGKYVAIASSPHIVEIVNLLKPQERDTLKIDNKEIRDIVLLNNYDGSHMLVCAASDDVIVKRMDYLDPYYGKLIREESDEKLNEWLKMMPGETMEQYNMRVNEESRRRMLSRFEQEAATRYAGDLVSMSTITLGSYNPENETLEIGFSNMSPIYLNVPEGSLQAFDGGGSLEFHNTVYGVNDDDSFDLIYAEVLNRNNGVTYVFDNLQRATLNHMSAEDNTISLDVIRQHQMEEVKLQEIKEQVIEDARHENLISEHTNISVDSRIETDYDGDGNRILNYCVKFAYTVDPEYTLIEDYGPGKYKIEESGAASAMMDIMKKALEGDLAQYVVPGKKLYVALSGSADATPIHRALKYDACYGEYEAEPVTESGKLTTINVNRREGLATNEQLAFVRALGVKDYIEKNIDNITSMNTDYSYDIEVSGDKGSQYRRITAELKFIDAF